MHFEPFNRHLWVMPQLKNSTLDEKLFVMPDEYVPAKDPFTVCEIIGISDDCELQLKLGDTIIVDTTTLLELKAKNETIYVVQENYVYGRLENEINQ